MLLKVEALLKRYLPRVVINRLVFKVTGSRFWMTVLAALVFATGFVFVEWLPAV